MFTRFAQMQKILAYVASHLDTDVSLQTLAVRSHLSRYHLHRVFARAVGETPANLALRLRLGRAAVLLLTTRRSVLDVALSSGFQSHETFCRAFRRRFSMTPQAYRKRGFVPRLNAAQTRAHIAFSQQVAPCVGLYHIGSEEKSEENAMTYSIEKKMLPPQPVLVVRRKVKRSEIAATIGQTLPHIFAFAQQHAIALSGLPFTRYIEMGPGLVTMEPGMRIAASSGDLTSIGKGQTAAAAESEVVAGTLPGGPVATTLHIGPYENLSDAYAAIQHWIETQGLAAAGAPWESYVTDPGENPNPSEWKTEVFWPLAG